MSSAPRYAHRRPGAADDAQAREQPRGTTPVQAKPMLLFFYSPTSGSSRRVEAFLAQVLQHRHNHDTFTVRRLAYQEHQELAERLGIEQTPALVVVERNRVQASLEHARGCGEITTLLAPWLK